MGTFKARQALDDNLKRHLNSRSDPVMWNVCLALTEITRAIDDLETKIGHVSRQVAEVAMRQRR